jgi:hypothetical protein
MGRTLKSEVLERIRPLVEQGMHGPAIAQALGISEREARRYAQQLTAGRASSTRPEPSPTPAAPTPEDVPLGAIHLEGDTKARVAIDGHLVKEYAESMTEGAQFPPVILFRDPAGYWIGDGHHRCRAARQVGLTTIRAEVQAGGEREALLYACGANATHGLRRDALDRWSCGRSEKFTPAAMRR